MTMSPQIPSNPTITDLLVAVVRVEQKIDGFASGHDDHEMRIRALEHRRWPLQSAAILVSVAAAGLSGLAIITQ